MAWYWRAMIWIVGISTTVLLAAFGGLLFAIERTAQALPAYETMQVAPAGRTVRIRASDGTVMQTLGPAYGEWLPYDRIPGVMRQAVIAIEDRRYEQHWGVDPKAIIRVSYLAWKYHGTTKRLQGASTITQQAARTLFLSHDYDIRRKLKEMIIALAIERRLDKERILELYLNRVYLGGGAYGIDAASRKFFGHPASKLTLGEAALLAGLAKAPSDYSPSADPEAAYSRMKVVLDVMEETGVLSKKEKMLARESQPPFASEPQPQGNGARYFTDWITPQFNAIIADAVGAIDVWTTFDPKLQTIADETVSKHVPKGAQGALLSLDADGAIRAMVGGADYQASAYNRATQALRQPGSSFKLFVYIAALENGYHPGSAVADAPITIAGWSPRNASGRYAGAVTLGTALAQSYNTVAARLGQAVGIETIARTATRFGFSTRLNIDPAMVLGTSEARLIDMTRAYASIASGGIAVAPYGISKITIGGGKIYEHQKTTQLLTPPHVARDMTAMLRAVVTGGTGREAYIGRPVSGKTGTTTSNRDGLFIGFSSGITTGVWIGRDDAKPIPELQGGRAPARIFAAYMRKAVAGRPPDETTPAIPISPDDEVAKVSAPPKEEDNLPDNEIANADRVPPEPLVRYGRSRALPLDNP